MRTAKRVLAVICLVLGLICFGSVLFGYWWQTFTGAVAMGISAIYFNDSKEARE